MLIQTQFQGRESLGVYARASEKACLVPSTLADEERERIEEALEVPVIPMTVGGTTIVGALSAMNSNGVLLADIVHEHEAERLENEGLSVGVLEGVVNAAGNAVLCNDNGAVADPRLPEALLTVIEKTLEVDVEIGTVGGVRTPATSALATNRGALVHPKATEAEVATVEAVLGVEAMAGTVNHGSPYVGSGVVANEEGALIGTTTTGPELNRLEEALGYLD